MTPWKREFLYFKYPDLPAKDDHRIEQLILETDFESREAKVFRAGWDHCVHCVSEATVKALNEVA